MITAIYRRAVPLAIGLAVLVPGTALASTGLNSTIKAQDKIIRSSPGYVDLAHSSSSSVAQIKTQIPELESVENAIGHAATAVSQAHATTARQKTGQQEWVRGAHELASAVGQIDGGLSAYVHGNESQAKRQVLAGEKKLAAANKLGDRADKLLGLANNVIRRLR